MKRKPIIYALSLLLMLITRHANAQTDPATQLNQLLSSFRTYQADFHQVTVDSDDRVLQTSQGRVMIQRPGLFRWESDSPTKQIIIVDGKTLWVYDVDLSQATRQSIDQQTNINPASLLSGSIANLTQQFTITASENGAAFRLVPKHDMNFKWVRVLFQRGQLVEMTVLNNLDETSTFKFTHIQINQRLSPSLFQFKPPPGVDVVTQ